MYFFPFRTKYENERHVRHQRIPPEQQYLFQENYGTKNKNNILKKKNILEKLAKKSDNPIKPINNYLPKQDYYSGVEGNENTMGSWVPYHNEKSYAYRRDYLSYGGPYLHDTHPNDIINTTNLAIQPWDATLWDHPLDPDVCRTLAGLTRAQLHLCKK